MDMTRTLAPFLLLLAAVGGLGCAEKNRQEEELSAVVTYPFEDTWTATVVEEVDGVELPVPGARVEVSDFAFRMDLHTFDPAFFGEDAQGYRQEHMHVTWTDAEGKVQVPLRYRSILASQEGRAGFHVIPVCGNGPPWVPVATLTPLVEQQVQVLDHRGNPVEGARVVTAEDSWSPFHRHLALTDADGLATLSFARGDQEGIRDGERFLEVIAVGHDAVTFHPGSMDDFPEVVELQLPPYRNLHVEFRTPDGLPYQGPLEFIIQSDAPAPETRFEGGTLTGRTRLPCLEAEFPLRIRANAMDGTLRGYLEEDLIPPTDDVDWTVVVNLEWKGYLVRGRLLDLDRHPLAWAEVEVTLYPILEEDWEKEEIRERVVRGRSDGDGNFEVMGFYLPHGWRGLKVRITSLDYQVFELESQDWQAPERGVTVLGDILVEYEH